MISTKFRSTSNINKIVCFVSQNKVDLIIMNFLGFITIFSSVFLLQYHAEIMYDIDSYGYYYLSIFQKDNLFVDSLPFVKFLSLVQEIVPNTDQLLLLRIINTIFVVQLVLFIYLIGRKIFNPFFAAVGTLLVSFSPLLTSYSVTLHNDIFAISMGFAALFFMIKPKSINLIIAAIFLLVTGLTRADTALVFFVPFIISISYFASKKIHVRFFYFLILLMTVLFAGGIFLSQNPDIYSSRFSGFDRLILFLNFDTIYTVWNTASNITQNELLNHFFSSVLFVCSIVFLVNYRKKIIKFFNSGGDNFNSCKIAVLYLTIVFFISLISAATLHVGYTIDEEKDLLIIKERITDRYVILIQILILFGFTLVASLFSASQNLFNKIRDKRSQRSIEFVL